ncbi:unnamed protein product [Somion occarium]
MLSSLGFDMKSAGRTASRNGSKYVLEVPRGFSVHVLKNPAPPPAVIPAKLEYSESQNRSVPGAVWTKPSSYPSRQDTDRKATPPDSRQLSVYAPPFEPKRSKSHRPYQIYPSSVNDTYIYERSVSSASDLLASPASTSSSDSDFSEDHAMSLSLEVSSTRASSSTETLETTALIEQNSRQPFLSVSPPATQPVAFTTRSSPPGPAGVISSRNHTSRPVVPFPSVAVASDDDSDTVVSEGDQENAARPYLAQSGGVTATSIGASLPLSTPIRRNALERSSSGRPSETISSGGNVRPPLCSMRTDSSIATYDEINPRAPPGLQPAAPTRNSPTLLPPQPNLDSVLTIGTRRCVRWTENLIWPSPTPRRKGWFNRRGDQLWTNDGRFKSPEPGLEYPPDLSNYPEPNNGWMNEDGVRIDMQHRLVPKSPLRSALKRPKSTTPSPTT